MRSSTFDTSTASPVYVAQTFSIIPALRPAADIADKLYSLDLCTARVNTYAKRAAKKMGIQQRSIVVDVDRLPEKILVDRRNAPAEWCATIINALTNHVPLAQIGFLGVAYNASSHADSLPNLACQAALRMGMTLEAAPLEFANYGCAGGFFPLAAAVKYCQHHQKAAIVIAYDQCSMRGMTCYDEYAPMFRNDLRTNLLFSDGAVGLLLIPESMRSMYSCAPPLVNDMQTGFSPSSMIGFSGDRFVLSEGIADFIPRLVADSVIKPILKEHGLAVSNIPEWSIHQGSLEILRRFANPSILDLTATQFARSESYFVAHGNMSAASCFLVFDSFMKAAPHNVGAKGMIVGFGAGLYQAALLYEWR